ncbi:MAG: fibro-slime domain-containing protein [Planctomycetota bacterium]
MDLRKPLSLVAAAGLLALPAATHASAPDPSKLGGAGEDTSGADTDGQAGSYTPEDLPETLVVSAVIRDFKAYNQEGGHDDFQRYSGTTRIGLVADELGEDGKPVLASQTGFKITSEFRDSSGNPINPRLYDPALGDSAGSLEERSDNRIYSAEGFKHWYNDVPGVNVTKVVPLELRLIPGTSTYVFDSAQDQPYKSIGGFFPINGEGYGNYSGGKNFHFTTEVATEFVYRRGEGFNFKFTGDDDVWVFVDGKLVIDMGSLHSRKEQHLDLDRLEWLEDGKVYSLHVFHAERRTSQSNFRIQTTLQLRPIKTAAATGLHD